MTNIERLITKGLHHKPMHSTVGKDNTGHKLPNINS